MAVMRSGVLIVAKVEPKIGTELNIRLSLGERDGLSMLSMHYWRLWFVICSLYHLALSFCVQNFTSPHPVPS